MTEAGKEIAILSLGQILAVSQESITDPKAAETVNRHVRQVAAIIQGKVHNKPDEETERLMAQVARILSPSPEVSNA